MLILLLLLPTREKDRFPADPSEAGKTRPSGLLNVTSGEDLSLDQGCQGEEITGGPAEQRTRHGTRAFAVGWEVMIKYGPGPLSNQAPRLVCTYS